MLVLFGGLYLLLYLLLNLYWRIVNVLEPGDKRILKMIENIITGIIFLIAVFLFFEMLQ